MLRLQTLTKKYPHVFLKNCVEFLDHLRKPIKANLRIEGQYPYYGANGQQGTINNYIFDEELLLLAEDGGFFGQEGKTIAYTISGKSWVNNHAHVLRPKENVNLNYLCYILSEYDVTPFTTGTTRAKLTKSAAQEIPIPLPPLEEQKRIAAILDKAHSIRQKRQQNLENANALIKSVFLDMFGDPVTKLWATVPIEQLATVKVGVVIKPAQYYTTEKEGVRAFRSLNVGEMHIKNNNWVYFSEKGNTVNKKSILQENDILVVRSGYPGTSCVVTKDYVGSNAIDLIIATPNTSIANPYFLSAYINSPYGKKQILQGQGGAAQQHFNVGALRTLLVKVPPIDIQNKFAKTLLSIEAQKAKQQKHLHEADQAFKALQQQFFG